MPSWTPTMEHQVMNLLKTIFDEWDEIKNYTSIKFYTSNNNYHHQIGFYSGINNIDGDWEVETTYRNGTMSPNEHKKAKIEYDVTTIACAIEAPLPTPHELHTYLNTYGADVFSGFPQNAAALSAKIVEFVLHQDNSGVHCTAPKIEY